MGHKVHPMGFRLGVIRDWKAKWYADKHFVEFIQEDLKLRGAIQSRYREAGISQVEISRQANEVSIAIYTARPGVVIGRGGQRVDETRLHLEQIIGKRVRLNIMEVQQPELDATLVARVVAEQIERRIAYRRAMKQAISRSIQAGAKGIRISCAGRLGGAEIARRQTMHDGRVPLHTLRADIDYGFIEARTTLGRIGVKVWIYRGDILPETKVVEEVEETVAEPVTGEVKETAAEPVVSEVEETVAEPVTGEVKETVAEPVTGEVKETAAEPVTGEVEETVAEPVTGEVEETAAEPVTGEVEETVAEPVVGEVEEMRAESVVSEVEETLAEPVAESVEAAPAVKPKKKPTKPRARRVKAVASAEVGGDTAKTTVDIVKEVESSITEKEEKDVTTEAGKTPQDS